MNNCNCPNFTDDKCCHESIRLKTEVVGVDSDIKHEFERIERRQKQARKDKDIDYVWSDDE